MSGVLLIGPDLAGTTRARMVRPGGDVLNPDYNDILFDSDFTLARVLQSGEVNFESNWFGVSIPLVDQGYIPYVLGSLSAPEDYFTTLGLTGNIHLFRTVVSYSGLTPVFSTSSNVGNTWFVSTGTFWDPTTQQGNTIFPPPEVRARCVMPYMYYEDGAYDNGREHGWQMRVYRDRLEIYAYLFPTSANMVMRLTYYVFAMGAT